MDNENKKLESEIQKLAADVSESAPRSDAKLGIVPESASEEEISGKPKNTDMYIDPAEAERRKKQFRGGCITAGKIALAFVGLALTLGIIGLIVIWLIDNSQSVKFWEQSEKQSVEEVLKNTEEFLPEEPVTAKPKEEAPESEIAEQVIILRDPAVLKILALNGGGAKGSAGAVRDYLKEKEYILTEADNASIFTYKGVTVFYTQDENKADAEKLQEALEQEYDGVELKKAETQDEMSRDIVVIVGTQK